MKKPITTALRTLRLLLPLRLLPLRLSPRLLLPLLLLPLALLLPAIAHAEIVLIVNPDNPVNTLTAEQVARIFLRKKSNLPGGMILTPVDQPKGPLRDAFYEKYVGMNRARISAYWAQRVFTGAGEPPRQTTSEEDIPAIVAATPDLIGYIESAQITGNIRVVAITP